MSQYVRVMPRDLFNEGSLLNLHGRLMIMLEMTNGHRVRVEQHELDRFEIVQDAASGSISIANFVFTVGGCRYRLTRPLNSRAQWPLWLEDMDPEADFDALPVFDDEGDLSRSMLDFIR